MTRQMLTSVPVCAYIALGTSLRGAGNAPETIVDLDESAMLAAALALAPSFSDALGSFIAPERICHE